MKLLTILLTNTFTIPPGMIKLAIWGTPILLITALLVITVIRRENRIEEDGIYTEGIVVKCEKTIINGVTTYKPFVKFMGYDGNYHEYVLNCSCNLPIGRVLTIKYLPGRSDCAILIGKEEYCAICEEKGKHKNCNNNMTSSSK